MEERETSRAKEELLFIYSNEIRSSSNSPFPIRPNPVSSSLAESALDLSFPPRYGRSKAVGQNMFMARQG